MNFNLLLINRTSVLPRPPSVLSSPSSSCRFDLLCEACCVLKLDITFRQWPRHGTRLSDVFYLFQPSMPINASLKPQLSRAAVCVVRAAVRAGCEWFCCDSCVCVCLTLILSAQPSWNGFLLLRVAQLEKQRVEWKGSKMIECVFWVLTHFQNRSAMTGWNS